MIKIGNPCSAAALWIVWLWTVSSCALDYQALTPFPCPEDGKCPAGLVCVPSIGCTTASEQPSPACVAFESLGPLSACGSANFTTRCANGSICPANSYCVANNQCVCNPGFKELHCDGRDCDADCTYPDWWCVPDEVSGSCAATFGWGPQIMHCADGRDTPTNCDTQASCDAWCAAPAAGCDTVSQNCYAAAAPKCNLLSDPSGNAATGCVAQPGQLAPGAVCQPTGNGSDGLDDCIAGSLCTGFGAAAGTRLCRRFCREDTQCPASYHCLPLSDLKPRDGVCLPDCQLFMDCPNQMSCTPFVSLNRQIVGYCRTLGSGGSAAACQDDTECAADLSCESDGAGHSCVPLCDSAHACTSGTCSAFYSTTLLRSAGECF